MANLPDLRVDISKINRKAAGSISNVVGYQVKAIPILEGSTEELGNARGEYRRKGKDEKILLAQRYVDLDRERVSEKDPFDILHLASPILMEYFTTHRGDAPLDFDSLLENYNEKTNHVIEDVLIHEYAHKVFHDSYLKPIVERGESREGGIDYILAAETFNESFARWLHAIVVGHEHRADIASLYRISARELRENGVEPFYTDRKQIAESYGFLVSVTNKKRVKYVLDNMVDLAIDHFEAVYARRSEELIAAVDQEMKRLRQRFHIET